MPRAARTDSNHSETVEALEKAGCLVQSLASVGGGVPDLLVATPRFRRLMLQEVKDGQKPPSKRQRTPLQVRWHSKWSGAPVCVVYGPEEAVRIALELDRP